jgi:hypothetical protein
VKPTEKLIELIEAQGLQFHSIHRAKGFWTHMHQDVQRFQVFVTFPGETRETSVGSWDTITTCARRGLEPIEKDRGCNGGIRAKPAKRAGRV